MASASQSTMCHADAAAAAADESVDDAPAQNALDGQSDGHDRVGNAAPGALQRRRSCALRVAHVRLLSGMPIDAEGAAARADDVPDDGSTGT